MVSWSAEKQLTGLQFEFLGFDQSIEVSPLFIVTAEQYFQIE